MPAFDPVAILSALSAGDVRFVVIGGWAAGVQGAGWPTQDIDIMVEASDENLARLARVLERLEAAYEPPRTVPIRPTLERLRALPGPQLLDTRFGRLDVLRSAGVDTYESLVADSVVVRQAGHSVFCAGLPALLRLKRASGRPKDARTINIIERAIASQDEEDP